VPASSTALPFRFDAANHEYVDIATGVVLPHITGMLEAAGLIDTRWFSEECKVRGTEVHTLTRDYDLGALDVESCTSRYKRWLQAHVKAMDIIRPAFDVNDIERTFAHPTFGYAGRPDRVGRIYGQVGVLEIKSGPPEASHAIQTALQAMLVEQQVGVPARFQVRFALYLQGDGKHKLREHKRDYDFDVAREIIRKCCGR
jgi:hypothetical protein